MGHMISYVHSAAGDTHRVVSVDEVDHVLDDGIAGGLWRLAHHAEVQVHQVAASGGQQIAGVRICTRGGEELIGLETPSTEPVRGIRKYSWK